MYYYYIKFTAGNGAVIGNFECGSDKKIEYFSDIQVIRKHIAKKTGYTEDKIVIDMIYPVVGKERP